MNKKKKKIVQKPSPKQKSQGKIILFGIIGILILLLVYFLWWVPTQARIEADKNNPARKLAEIMTPFAAEQKLQTIIQTSDADCLGSLYCFNYKYQGSNSISSVKKLVTEYLKENGYVIKGYHYSTNAACQGYQNNKNKPSCDLRLIKNPVNEGHPIWLFSGKNEKWDAVYGTVSDKTYMNAQNSSELIVPPGNVVLDITFISSQK